MNLKGICTGIVALALFFQTSSWGDQLIIEPDMGRAPIHAAINSAQHSIALVMYGFTDKSLLKDLLQEKNLGRDINVILEQSPYQRSDENTATIATLKSNHIPWQGTIKPFRFIHQKTLLIDDSKALVMTFNFTNASFKNERNFGLIIDDPNHIAQIKAAFAADWRHQITHPTDADLIWSPDNSRDKLMQVIEQAQSSIKIYAQSISDFKMVGALAKAAKRGVKVQILTSTPLREKQTNYLERAGVNIHLNKQYLIHAKVFIIDDQQAILGSINLTRTSLENNRELSVISHDPKIVQELNTVFTRDWGEKLTTHDIKKLFHNKRLLARAVRLLNKYLNEKRQD